VAVVSGEGLGVVSERLGLFATRAGSCSISLETPDVTVDEISANSTAPRGDAPSPASLTVDIDRRILLSDVSLGRFGSRMFALQAVIPFALSATVSAEEAALTVAVDNGTGRALRGCFLVRGGRGYPLGDLAAGSTTSDVSSTEGIDLRARGAADRLCGDPRRAALWTRAEPEAGSDVLFGWMDGPLLSAKARGAQRPPDRPPLSLVMVRLR
jgi:hypothetical protein